MSPASYLDQAGNFYSSCYTTSNHPEVPAISQPSQQQIHNIDSVSQKSITTFTGFPIRYCQSPKDRWIHIAISAERSSYRCTSAMTRMSR